MLRIKNLLWLDPDNLTVIHADLVVEAGPGGGLTVIPKAGANFGDAGLAGEALFAPTLIGASDEATGQSPKGIIDGIIDGKGRLATRSFVCGHQHIYSALARGAPPSVRPVDTFAQMLENVWWRLDRCLDLEMIEASALVLAMHCAKRGCTFIIDHHSGPMAIRGSLATISRSIERVGLGHLLCYEISGRDGPQAARQGLEETEAWLSGHKGHVGLHASFTVDDDLLRQAVDLAKRYNTGLHIHVAESIEDQLHCLSTYGLRVVQRLQRAGALLPGSIFAHCVHLDAEERALLADAPVWVAQCVESNLNNGVGLGHYAGLPKVMLGTDGMHGDMLRALQSVWYAGGLAEDRIQIDGYRRLRAGHQHVATLGAPGDSANNLVIFNYDRPTPITSENALGHIIYGLDSRHVDTVIAQGRVIVSGGRLTGLDEDSALAFAREQAKRLWSKLPDQNPDLPRGRA